MVNAELSCLIGKTMTRVENMGDEIHFHTNDGEQYRLFHDQDCCENVYVDDVCGDLEWLVGWPFLISREDSNTPSEGKEDCDDSFTWSFYNFATSRGYVTIKFYGESNGYYSERVDFEKVSA